MRALPAALLATSLWLLANGRFPERPTDPPARRLSTLERMAMPRLAAVHQDILHLARQRRPIPPLTGLQDFRVICHAHADDSVHTGGTRTEMLADAHRAGVHAIFLSDHFRPPRDFMESWRGLHEGVLFVPGSEMRGFLVHPTDSILASKDEPTAEFLAKVRANGGLAFLSHVEERPDHPMDSLDGMEIYNRHWDAKKDRVTLLALVLKLTQPREVGALQEALARFPDELLGAQIDYPADYLAKWDAETPARRLTGIAANDAHHNQVFLVKMVDESTVLLGTIVDPDEKKQSVSALLRPGIREMTRGRKAGDELVRLDFDPYHRSFRNVCTHVLAPELSEAALRNALKAGHAYVSHDWMADPTGFRFLASTASPSQPESPPSIMGDEAPLRGGLQLHADFPIPCSRIRLLRNGLQVGIGSGRNFDFRVREAGTYRMEGWLLLDGEERAWILSNPIYVR
jgi:hypothetical protein